MSAVRVITRRPTNVDWPSRHAERNCTGYGWALKSLPLHDALSHTVTTSRPAFARRMRGCLHRDTPRSRVLYWYTTTYKNLSPRGAVGPPGQVSRCRGQGVFPRGVGWGVPPATAAREIGLRKRDGGESPTDAAASPASTKSLLRKESRPGLAHRSYSCGSWTTRHKEGVAPLS